MKGTTTVPPAVSPEEAPSPAARLLIVREAARQNWSPFTRRTRCPPPSPAAELTITREPF